MTTIKFLQKKSDTKLFNRWGQDYISHHAGSGNINVITDNILYFNIYNYLPSCDEDSLSGHYGVYVNYKTFEYAIYKMSDYGGLTYVTELNEPFKILLKKDLSKFEILKIESYIANKLLTAYHNDYSGVSVKKKIYLFSEKNKSYHVGGSLICDYRGYVWGGKEATKRSEIDLIVIPLLDKDFEFETITEINYSKKNYFNVEVYKDFFVFTIVIEFIIKTSKGRTLTLHHRTDKNKFNQYSIIRDGEKKISINSLSHTLKDMFNILPDIMRSL